MSVLVPVYLAEDLVCMTTNTLKLICPITMERVQEPSIFICLRF